MEGYKPNDELAGGEEGWRGDSGRVALIKKNISTQPAEILGTFSPYCQYFKQVFDF